MAKNRFSELNAQAWDEVASTRAVAPNRDAWGYVHAAVRPHLTGNGSLLHLQCADGLQTFNLMGEHRRVLGVDISKNAVQIASQTYARYSPRLTFLSADVLDLRNHLTDTFDTIFTGDGALVWLSDLDVWAEQVARSLEVGGQLIVFDSHPFLSALRPSVDGQSMVPRYNYFGGGVPRISSSQWSHFEAGATQQSKYLFDWAISDVVNAVIGAGLRLTRLEEVVDSRVLDRWKTVDLQDLPSGFLLLAVKDL